MTMIDYALMAASAAAILIVAAYWWRRAPETARIVATEVGWCLGSFYAALYVWSQLAGSRPLRVVAIGNVRARRHLGGCPAAHPRSKVDSPRGGCGGAPRGWARALREGRTRWRRAPEPPPISRRAGLDEP